MTSGPDKVLAIVEARIARYRAKEKVYADNADAATDEKQVLSWEAREERMRHTAEALELLRNDLAAEFGLPEQELTW